MTDRVELLADRTNEDLLAILSRDIGTLPAGADVLSAKEVVKKSPAFRELLTRLGLHIIQQQIGVPIRDDLLEKGDRELSNYIPELVALCRERKMTTIKRGWILDNYRKLDGFITDSVKKRGKSREDSWAEVGAMLAEHGIQLEAPPVKTLQKKGPATIADYVDPVVNACIAENMFTVNRSWVGQHATNLQKVIAKQAATQEEKDALWAEFGRLLQPHGITLLPSIREKDVQVQLVIDELILKVLETDPETFTPSQIGGLIGESRYQKLQETFGTKEGVRWSLLARRLPPVIRDKFIAPTDVPALTAAYPQEEEFLRASKLRQAVLELRRVLEEKRPETFSPDWIQQHASTAYGRLLRLKGRSEDLDWYGLIASMGDEWLLKFETYAQSPSDVAKRLDIFLRSQNIPVWSKHSLYTHHRALHEAIHRQLSEHGKEWEDFLEMLPAETMNRYNAHDDSREGKHDRKYGSYDEQRRQAVQFLNRYAENRTDAWSFHELERDDPSLHCTMVRLGGMQMFLHYLSSDALARVRSRWWVTRYQILAERTRRALRSMDGGWRLRDLPSDLQKDAERNLPLFLSYLPTDVCVRFLEPGERDAAPARTRKVLDKGSEDPAAALALLQSAGYNQSGVVTRELLDGLSALMKKGDAAAAIIADNILETYVTIQGMDVSIPEGRHLSEVLLTLPARGSWESAVLQHAFTLAQADRRVRLDAQTGDDEGGTIMGLIEDRSASAPDAEVSAREEFEGRRSDKKKKRR